MLPGETIMRTDTRILIAALISAPLAGCASDYSVRSRAPDATFTSDKSPDESVSCLVPSVNRNYQSLDPQRFVAQTIRPSLEYDIVPARGMVNNYYYLYTINVKKSKTGSDISLFIGQPILPYITNSVIAGIKECTR